MSFRDDGSGLHERMSTAEQPIELEGMIKTVLPGTMFRVTLDNQHEVLAHISGKMRKHFVRLTVGDRVRMEMSLTINKSSHYVPAALTTNCWCYLRRSTPGSVASGPQKNQRHGPLVRGLVYGNPELPPHQPSAEWRQNHGHTVGDPKKYNPIYYGCPSASINRHRGGDLVPLSAWHSCKAGTLKTRCISS